MTDSCLFSPVRLQAALEMLLLRKPVRLKCHPLANYHYAGRLPGALCPPLLPESRLSACWLCPLLITDSTRSVLSAACALKASGA